MEHEPRLEDGAYVELAVGSHDGKTLDGDIELEDGGNAGGQFDFISHGQAAVSEYLAHREFYVDLAHAVQRIVQECLRETGTKISAVDCRAKDALSFEKKASLASDIDPTVPKYNDPLRQITDLAGVRVITFFPNALEQVDRVINQQFEILERSDKGATLLAEDRFGYASVHYLVKLNAARTVLPEYERFRDSIAEIQVRTILQHAWAEIEHDIQYKSAAVIPKEVKRRFMSLAGLLELADREFQSIQSADVELNEKARSNIERGNLDVEITPVALKTYLDRKLGPDGRVSSFSYDWAARMLKAQGFRTIAQIDECLGLYDHDFVSRAAAGNRQGQLTRFELMLLASMGDNFIERHPYASEDWFTTRQREIRNRMRDQAIPMGNYDPTYMP